MAVQNSDRDLKSYKVAGATGTDYVVGYISAANTIARSTGTGVYSVGVIENNPTVSDDVARVCTLGITKCHAGTAAIAVGDRLEVDARGYVVKSALASTGPKIGYAEEASTQDGQLIEIKVLPSSATA